MLGDQASCQCRNLQVAVRTSTVHKPKVALVKVLLHKIAFTHSKCCLVQLDQILTPATWSMCQILACSSAMLTELLPPFQMFNFGDAGNAAAI